MTKEERNKKIIDLHNEGKTIQEIATTIGMSKGGIHKVLGEHINVGDIAPKKPTAKVKLIGNEERFTNFSGWVRTDVNTYCSKDTGEIVNLVYVPSKTVEDYGYFVKVKI